MWAAKVVRDGERAALNTKIDSRPDALGAHFALDKESDPVPVSSDNRLKLQNEFPLGCECAFIWPIQVKVMALTDCLIHNTHALHCPSSEHRVYKGTEATIGVGRCPTSWPRFL